MNVVIKSGKCPEYDGKNLIPLIALAKQYFKHSNPDKRKAVLYQWRDNNYTRITAISLEKIEVHLSKRAVALLREFINGLCQLYGERHILITKKSKAKRKYARQFPHSVAPSVPSKDDQKPDAREVHEQYVYQPRLTQQWGK